MAYVATAAHMAAEKQRQMELEGLSKSLSDKGE